MKEQKVAVKVLHMVWFNAVPEIISNIEPESEPLYGHKAKSPHTYQGQTPNLDTRDDFKVPLWFYEMRD
ncbi:MAG: hypothetical protein ACE5HI_01940 [bacterium]